MNKIYLWISLGIIVISINVAKSFTGITSHRSIYVYDLIKNTNWPRYKSKGTFVIGVLGNSTALNELKDLSTKRRAAGRTIVVKRLASIEAVKECNVVYISPENNPQVKEVTNLIKNEGILVVTEGPGMSKKGGAINLISQEGKLTFEINKTAALQAKLTFSDQILAKGKAIN